jgi:HEAT repeat protein
MNLGKIFVFIPLLLPVWEKMPFDSLNTEVPRAPFYADSAAIRLQADYYSKNKDARINSRIAVSLAISNNPVAVEVLEGLLQNEKNTLAQADILSALYNMRGIGNCKKISLLKALLKSPNASARAFAAALYMKASNDVSPVCEMLAAENSEFVIKFIWSEISSSIDLCMNTRDSDMDKFQASENHCQRAGAVRVAVIKSQEPDGEARLNKILSDKDIMVRYALASALALKKKGGDSLLKALSDDREVSIRAMVASACPSEGRRRAHVKLSSDSDEEVRRLACVSLGAYKDMDSINALIPRIGDGAKQVRDAAERSLVKINPDKDVQKRIGDECLNSRESRAAAVAVLGELNDARFSPEILKLLQSADDKEVDFVRRCVTSLCNLDYRESCNTLMAKASHSDAGVREAVASALGKFKMKDSYETILKLSDDKVVPVSAQAIESMGWTADPFFSDKLLAVIKKTVGEYPAENRSYACWSIAKINSPSKQTLSQLNDLCMKTVLTVPMSPNTFDMDFVRISALFALIDMGRTNPAAKKMAEDIISAFMSEGKSADQAIAGDILKEYARQAKAYMENEKISPVEVKPEAPNFLLEEMKKK